MILIKKDLLKKMNDCITDVSKKVTNSEQILLCTKGRLLMSEIKSTKLIEPVLSDEINEWFKAILYAVDDYSPSKKHEEDIMKYTTKNFWIATVDKITIELI